MKEVSSETQRRLFVLAMGLWVLLVVLQGCSNLPSWQGFVWGTPEVSVHDPNSGAVVVIPAAPGLLPPIVEVFSAVAVALGMPVLALWIRAVSAGLKKASDTLIAARANGQLPSDPA
jgi:hypothetical protein